MNPTIDPADEQAALWAARLDGSVLSADERLALDHWLSADPSHRRLLSAYCQFSADLEQQLPSLAGIKERSVERRAPASATALPLPWLRWPTLAGVALTAVAAVVFFFWPAASMPQAVNLATPVAERQLHLLSDGTRMELNARTAITIEFEENERRVRLASGQAYFAVAKDASRPFVVETPAGAIRVTGTEFDLQADGDVLAVTVAEGSVQVRPRRTGSGASAPVLLAAGDAFSTAPNVSGIVTLTAAELRARLAWREGYAEFSGTKLGDAVAHFARYHGRGIAVAPEVSALRVGGRYRLDDLNGFLLSLEDVLPVHVSRDLDGNMQVRPRRP